MKLAPIAANTDPITSHIAAADYTASHRQSDKARVLAALRMEPLLVTSAELAMRHGMDRHAVARRLSDLAADGWAQQCNDRTCAVSGRLSMTWRPCTPKEELAS